MPMEYLMQYWYRSVMLDSHGKLSTEHLIQKHSMSSSN